MLRSVLGTSSTYSIVRRTETHQEEKSCSCCPPVSLGLCSLLRALSFPNVPGQEGDSPGCQAGAAGTHPRLARPLQRASSPLSLQRKARSWSVPGSERPLSPGISIPRANVLFCRGLSHSETDGYCSAHRWMQVVWEVRAWLIPEIILFQRQK